MNSNLYKIEEVIEDFVKIRSQDAGLFHEFLEKSLNIILRFESISIDNIVIVELILKILDEVNEPSEVNKIFYFEFKDSTKNLSLINTREKISDDIIEIIVTEKIFDDFVTNSNLLKYKEHTKELVTLTAISLLIERLKTTKGLKKSITDTNESNNSDQEISLIEIDTIKNTQEKKMSPTAEEILRYKLGIYTSLNKHILFKYILISFIYNQTEQEKWVQSKLQNINIDVYGKLIWSILNAEFFKIDTYSNLLENQIKNLKLEDLTVFYDEKVIPYIYYSLINLFELMIERCRVVRTMFNEANENIDWISIDAINHTFISNFNKKGFETTINFELLVKGLCDITDIDLVYITNKDNIKKLIRVLKQVNLIKTQICFEPNYPSSKNFSEALDIINAKASLLLYGMLNQNLPETQTISIDYLIGELNTTNSVNLEYDKYFSANKENNLVSLINSNPFLKVWHEKKGHKLDVFKDFQINNQSNFYPNITDIDRYNNFVKIGITNDCHLSTIIETLNNNIPKKQINDDDFKIIINHIHEVLFGNNLKPNSSFLFRAIVFLFNHIDKWDRLYISDKTDKNHCELIASQLISNVRNYIDIYSDGNKPRYSFRPLFENSFYSINGTNLLFDPKPSNSNFFFASITLAPFNIHYNERFYQKYKTILDHHIQTSSITLHHKNIKSIEEVNTRVARILTTLKTNIVREVRDKQEEERKSTVQLLGVFAALLAFVSMSIGMVKVADNILEYALFCCCFTSALLLFVLGIKFINNKEKCSNDLHWKKVPFSFEEKKILKIMFPIMLIAILLSLLSFTYKVIKDDKDGEKFPIKSIILQQQILKPEQFYDTDTISKSNKQKEFGQSKNN